MKRFCDRYLLNFMFGSSFWLLSFFTLFVWRSPPVIAAEKISFRYGLLEFSIPINSLETYATTGKTDRHLATYINSSNSQASAKFRKLLTYKLDIDSIIIYRFFNSYFGKTILSYLGEIIEIRPTKNGFYALRSALILATNEPEGLTLLNILQNFPTETIYIDGEISIKLADALVELTEQNKKAIATIQHQALIKATNEPKIDFTQQIDLKKPGSFTWKQETLTFNDTKRNRSFTAELYRPKLNTSIPVIIISPGLSADANDFDYLAQYLASYGFAVAVVNHPGSDHQRVENFFAGLNQEIVEAKEFIDRPHDISYLLDKLQEQEVTNSYQNGHLNLKQVGIIGHSFGAYTALALAGAKLNIEHLQQYCQSDAINSDSFNFSLLLQCLAAELPTTKNYQLSDQRIQAVFTMNLISSSIFGQRGLSEVTIPITLVAGTEDIITPALLEQIQPFTWLKSPDKYLLLIEKGEHVYSNTMSFDLTTSPLKNHNNYISDLSREHIKVISLAFMQKYLAENNNYHVFLSSNYAKYLSQDSLKLNLVNSLSKKSLNISD
ncbi:MAG: alpha/beta hydrolase [Waterburya sp.]